MTPSPVAWNSTLKIVSVGPAWLGRSAALSSPRAANEVSARAGISGEGLTADGSTSKLAHMVVCQIWGLVGCWMEGLHGPLAVGEPSRFLPAAASPWCSQWWEVAVGL